MFTCECICVCVLQRREVIERELAEKVSRHPNPFHTLVLNYGPNRPGKVFTEEEDRFLVCTLNQLEYGSWDSLKLQVRRAEQFRFDWFMKSRTPVGTFQSV